MILTYKYRVKDKHSRQLTEWAKKVNFVWNWCNQTQKDAVRWGKRWPTWIDLQNLSAGVSKELGLHAHTIQNVCKKYVESRNTAKKKYLRWRGKKALGWVPVPVTGIRIIKGQLKFSGIVFSGWYTRRIPDKAKVLSGSSFSQDSRGRWYLNLVLGVPGAQPTPNKKPIGVDLGLKATATTSEGDRIEAPQYYRKSQERLAKAQRANKPKQVRNFHAKVANQRKDFLHKASTALTAKYGDIYVGNVSSTALAKTNLAKSVHDVGWGLLRQMLTYKAIRQGYQVAEVAEAYSTQTCCDCLAVAGPKGREGLVIREWACEACGVVHDRDVNAARNILRLGHETLAEGAVGIANDYAEMPNSEKL